MRISTSNDITKNFEPVDVPSISELITAVTNGKNWSCAVYRDNYRNESNFIQADCIALDIDDGMSLSEAGDAFKQYKHVIYTTASHQKPKHDVTCDRFRVILFLDTPITNTKDYRATWEKLKEEFPAIDSKCKDPCRYWKPGTYVGGNPEGNRIEKVVGVEKVVTKNPIGDVLIKGKFSTRTKDFLIFGAAPGEWNDRLHFAAKDIREQGYTKEEAIKILTLPTQAAHLSNSGALDDGDMRTIESAFNGEVRYQPRGVEQPFNFKNIGEFMSTPKTVDWLADGLFTVGGLSIWVGPPKSGKSTLTRQFARSVARGEKFLDRDVKAGAVFYLALEEQEEMLYSQFKRLGVNKDDDINIHVGPLLALNGLEALEQVMLDKRPALLVIDTLFLFADIKDGNNYNEVTSVLAKYRKLARESGAHIVCIHHQNKSGSGGASSIMGSSGIHGAVDCALIFNQHGNNRTITTSQRGGSAFQQQPVIYNEEEQTYELGVKEDF